MKEEAFKMATELVKDWEQRDKEGQFYFKDLVKDIKMVKESRKRN